MKVKCFHRNSNYKAFCIFRNKAFATFVFCNSSFTQCCKGLILVLTIWTKFIYKWAHQFQNDPYLHLADTLKY